MACVKPNLLAHELTQPRSICQPVTNKQQDKKGKGRGPAATINKMEPCDSFFNFFR